MILFKRATTKRRKMREILSSTDTRLINFALKKTQSGNNTALKLKIFEVNASLNTPANKPTPRADFKLRNNAEIKTAIKIKSGLTPKTLK